MNKKRGSDPSDQHTWFDDNVFYHARDPKLGLIGSYPTMAKWRSQGMGPPFYRMGGRIYYRGDHLNNYIRTNEVTPRPAL